MCVSDYYLGMCLNVDKLLAHNINAILYIKLQVKHSLPLRHMYSKEIVHEQKQSPLTCKNVFNTKIRRHIVLLVKYTRLLLNDNNERIHQVFTNSHLNQNIIMRILLTLVDLEFDVKICSKLLQKSIPKKYFEYIFEIRLFYKTIFEIFVFYTFPLSFVKFADIAENP